MRIKVECYAGFKGAERPVRFQLGGCWIEVEEILDRWYGPDDAWFKVRAGDGNLYILRYRPTEEEDHWTLESFRQGQGEV